MLAANMRKLASTLLWAAIAALAMRDLPFGLPKAIVTTMASGSSSV